MTSWRRLVLVLVAAVLLLSACAGPGLGSRPGSGPGFDEVMKDPGATADEIIRAAGPPDEVARRADGSMLVLWKPFIVPESEGPELEGATAWRLYDARGKAVHTYSSPDLEDLSLTATGDGFLLTEPAERNGFGQASLVEPTGELHRVPVDPLPRAVRRDDALVPGSEVQHFYRPADRTLHALLPQPGMPRDVVQWSEALLDADGTLWIQGYAGRRHWVAWSRDGGRTLQKRVLPLEQRGATPSQPKLAVGQGVVVVLTDQVNGDAGEFIGPRYLDVLSGDGRTTRRVTAETFPFLARVSVNPDLSVTTDGRVLVGDDDAGEWWISRDDSHSEFERLPVPKDAAFVRDLGGTLFAWGEWDHREVALQTSTDEGRHWRTFDVSG